MSRTAAWRQRVRRWLKPPRRLRVTRWGWIFVVGSLVIGLAAIPTGNNLLFLMLGAMLGLITVSGWLSETTIRDLAVRRRVPRGAVAGEPARITYEVRSRKRKLPSFSVEVGEQGYPVRAFVASVGPGETVLGRAEAVWPRRGVYGLNALTIATSFPFGLFRKERDVEIPDELVVWPRTDRPVRELPTAGGRPQPGSRIPLGAAGARGEYRGLRDFRTGDDPRDVHWKSTARRGSPVVREYEREASRAVWFCLDLRDGGSEDAELRVEIAAALIQRATQRGQPFGLATSDVQVPLGSGPGQLERAMDALARARFRPDAPPLALPAAATECLRISADLLRPR